MEWIRAVQTPERLSGEIKLPASKSISNRVLIIRALCEEKFAIHNLSEAEDTRLLYNVLEAQDNELYVRNAGTAMRFLTAYFACRESEVVLKGSARMHERPMAPLVNALRALGADIHYLENEGFPPLLIHGKKLEGGMISIDAGISSQYTSALLMMAPLFENGLVVKLEGSITSAPYIRLTLETMAYFSIIYEWKENEIRIPRQEYVPKDFYVESDWSAASYWYAMAACLPGSELLLPDLFAHSLQGDSVLHLWMRQFGVESRFTDEGCLVTSQNRKAGIFKINMQQQPDLVPAFASLCSKLRAPFLIHGTANLKYKESDRAAVLLKELEKTGAWLEMEENLLRSESYSGFPESEIRLESYDDHRMAMSWMIQAVNRSNVWIENPAATEKSYPGFWKDLEGVGFGLERKELATNGTN